MFLFILFIFLNSIYINTASDESSQNQYINRLPEKEKKEFLERVARRILKEVESNEGGPDLVSGEIPDEQLKLHSDYVNRLLKEETENLKRRNRTKEKKSNDTISLKIDIIKNAKTENEIQDIKRIVKKIPNVDKNVDNQADSILRTDDKEIKQVQENNKNTKDDISKVIDLTLREGVKDKERTPELVKKQDIHISKTQEKSQSTKDDQFHLDHTDKATNLTLRNNDALHNDKLQNDEKQKFENNNQRIDLTLRNNVKANNDSSKETINEKYKNRESDQNLTSQKHMNKPVSIEITFVNDADNKETSEKSKVDEKGEIQVKVVYDEDKIKKSETNIRDVTTVNMDAETTDPTTNSNVSMESNTNEKKLKISRKSFSAGIDDHVEVIDNQIARKKRKSKTDIDSTEISTNATNIDESQINDSQDSINNAESGNNTAVQTSNNLKMVSAPPSDTYINLTLGTEKINGSSNIENSSPSSILVINNYTENITRAPLDYKPDSITTKVEIQGILYDKLEQTTEKVEIQHTQINDFDANEKETVSDLDVTTLNHTESTTEEIVKMRTQYVTGYPEDSYENSTSKTEDVINTKPANTTANPNEIIHNITLLSVKPESHLNTSFFTQKFSDQENDHNTSKGKDINPQLRASSKNSTNEEEKVKSDLVKTKSEPQNTEHQNLESNIPVTKYPVIQYITSTTMVPLTTTENNNKKELYYAMEASVEILNDTLIARSHHNDTKEKLLSGNDLPEKILRKGLRPDKETEEDFPRIKINPEKKEYLVYELLPGQLPFKKKQSMKKRSENLNPKSYPKLSKYESKQEKTSYDGLKSQIEQPNYAPVYNYAPEYAYYNPKNKYGPNSNDEEVKIVDERSNELESDDVGKIFDYDIPTRVKKYNTKHRHGAKSDRPIIIELTNKNRFKDNREDKISEDYFFGLLNRYTNNKKRFLRVSDKCKGKKCKEPYVTVVQDPLVPPNSDEPHYAHNALLNYNPPVTHIQQVKNILGDLKYYHHNHHHLHDPKCNNVSYIHGSGETWVGPDLDLFFAKKISRGRFIRSGGDRSNEPKKSDKRFVHAKIPNHLKFENKQHLEKLNETFHMDENHRPSLAFVNRNSKHSRLKKRPMYLLTGGHKRTSNYTDKKKLLYLLTGRYKGGKKVRDHKRPMLLLTGSIGKNAKKDDGKHTLLLLTGNNKNFDLRLKNKRKRDKKYYKTSDVSSEEKYEMSKKIYNFDEIARTKPKSRSGESGEYYSDPDTYPDTKDLNLDVVSLIIKLSDNHRDPKYQQRLIAKFKKQGKLYSPPKKPKLEEYGELLNKLPILRSGSRNLEAYVRVMKDMIEQDSKALIQYDWLSSTVDIRSALNKLSQLSNSIQKNRNDIHPKDLQLVKYILYLYSKTKHLIEEANKEEIISAEESPLNMRFAYAEKDSEESPSNLRFPVEFTEYKSVQRRNRVSKRRFLERPWLKKDGLKKKMGDLNKLIEALGLALNDLHDAIKNIALVTNYRSQRWFENLKELYLTTPPSRKQALEIILHISTTRLISLIEESAANGLESNYVRYGLSNPEQVQRTIEEFAFVVDVYLALKK